MGFLPKKKFGILIPQFPGQTHIFFWREILEIEKRGVSIELFSTRKPPKSLMSHAWSIKAIGRTVYVADLSVLKGLSGIVRLMFKSPWIELVREEGVSILRDVIMALPATACLVEACQKRGVQHVHAHSCARAALICALASRVSEISYSVTLHGDLNDYGPAQGFKWRNAAFGATVTRKLESELRQAIGDNVPKRMYLQPMGVDTNHFLRASPYLPPEPGAPIRIFSCGRLHEAKGHKDVLSAVKSLRDQGLDIRLEIAGEDDVGGHGFRVALEQAVDQLDLRDAVSLLGAIDGEAVREKLEGAHIFILASWAEALGVAYMEAMSMEVPTIGTDVGGVHELISSGEDGVLLPRQAPEEIAAALRNLIEDRDMCMRLSAAGREKVVAQFSSARGAEVLIEAISSQPDH